MRKHCVYTLTDPRDSSIRYVGITKNQDIRLKEHLNTAKRGDKPKDIWIRELVTMQLQPIFTVIEEVEDVEEARIRERYWIRHHIEAGTLITNELLDIDAQRSKHLIAYYSLTRKP